MTKRKQKSPRARHPPVMPPTPSPLVPAVTQDTTASEPVLTPAPMMTPAVNAAYTLAQWAADGQDDIDALIVSFALQGRALRAGDLTDAERMLMAQASTLDVIFINSRGELLGVSIDP